MVKKTFLVTGGAGFIGSHLVERLATEGHSVICLDNEFRGTFKNFPASILKKITVKKGDVRKTADWPKYSKKIDALFHFAAINGTPNFYSIPDIVLDVNVRGTFNALEYAIDHNIPHVLFASSPETYGIPEKFPTPESEKLVVPDVNNPRWSYGASKTMGEVLCVNYAKKFGFKCSIIRYNNLYGPRDQYGHVIPDLLKKIRKNRKFTVEGKGGETRSFCYIDDAIDATLLIKRKQKSQIDVFNVGIDVETSIRDLIKHFERILNKKLEPTFKQKIGSGTSRRLPDITKIRKLGFKPKTSFDEGLRSTIEWYK